MTAALKVPRPAPPAPVRDRAVVVAELAAAREAEATVQASWAASELERRRVVVEQRRVARREAALRAQGFEYAAQVERHQQRIGRLRGELQATAPAWLVELLDNLRLWREHVRSAAGHDWILDPNGTRSPAEQEVVALARDPRAPAGLRQSALRRLEAGRRPAEFLAAVELRLPKIEALLLEAAPRPAVVVKALSDIPAPPCNCLPVPSVNGASHG